MKVLVTGGAGFIGSHLVGALIELNFEVTVLDNFSTGRPENLAHVINKIRLVECDISKSGEWSKELKSVNWVFHLAALADIVPSIQNPDEYFRSNVDGTFNLLQAAKFAEVKRFVYAASSSCYGIPDQYPTNECAEIRPQFPYSLTKRLVEVLVMHLLKIRVRRGRQWSCLGRNNYFVSLLNLFSKIFFSVSITRTSSSYL